MEIHAQYTEFERTESFITTNSMLEAADEKDYNKINEIKDKNLINLLNMDKVDNEDNNDDEEEEDEEEIIDDNNKIDYIIDINDNEDNNKKDEVLIPNKKPINLKDENYKNSIKLYLVLLIEFILAFAFTLFGFIFGLNDIFINNKTLKLTLFILITIILLVISISINFIPSKYLRKKRIYIYSITYILCIIISSFLLSNYINSKVILSSLGLIILDTITMEIYNLIIYYSNPRIKQKPFSINIYGYLLCPFISNVIVIIILHFCLIKDAFDTLYISIAGLFFISSNFILSHLLFKFYKKKGYIFNSIIISLSIYSVIGFGLKKCYKYIKPTFEQYHGANIKPFLFKTYSILLLEFIFIWLIIFLVFHYELNGFFINHKEVIFIPVSIVTYIMLFIFSQDKININIFILLSYIFYFISIILIILYGFLLSSFLETNVILSFYTLLVLDIFSIEIYILFYKEYNKWGMVLSPIIINIISLPLLYFFMVKDIKVLYIFLIFAVVILFLNLFIHTLLFEYLTIDYNNNYILTIMLIKLSLIVFMHSLTYCCNEYRDNEHEHNIDNNNAHEEDNKKNNYLCKVNIHLLIFVIIYICFFYIFNASGIIKYSNNIIPYSFFYIAVSGTTTILAYNIMFKKNEYTNSKELMCICIFLNFFSLIPKIYVAIIIFNNYDIIYCLWIIFFILLTMIIYTSISKKINYFLFLFHPLITYLIAYYIINYFWLNDNSSKKNFILITLGVVAYILIIEIILLYKNVNYDIGDVFYCVTVIIYVKYIIHAILMEIFVSIYYYMFKCCCSTSCNDQFESFFYFYNH